MNGSIHLRPMTSGDLPFADRLRAMAGWNQTLRDWERFVLLEPNGCFLAECHGAPAGTATTTIYSQALAWIGMVLVHPEFRRRGIGRALLDGCLSYLRGRGVGCIKLDATPAGLPLYQSLGFQTEWGLTRWERIGPPPPKLTQQAQIRPWDSADLPGITRLDRDAFGTSRGHLLTCLREQSVAAFVAGPGNEVQACGLIRPGSKAFQLGPIFGESVELMETLMQSLLEKAGDQQVFCDIPDLNQAATTWATGRGFKVQRPLTRMFSGENSCPGVVWKQFALAGPDIG